MGLVEAAWAKDNESVALLICDQAGDPVLLRYQFKSFTTDTLAALPDDVLRVLEGRYSKRLGGDKNGWGIPRWACSDSGATEFREQIGPSRELAHFERRSR